MHYFSRTAIQIIEIKKNIYMTTDHSFNQLRYKYNLKYDIFSIQKYMPYRSNTVKRI